MKKLKGFVQNACPYSDFTDTDKLNLIETFVMNKQVLFGICVQLFPEVKKANETTASTERSLDRE